MSSEAPSFVPASDSLNNIEAGISGGGGGVRGGEGPGSSSRGLWRHTLSSPGFGVNVSTVVNVPMVTLFFFLPQVPLPLLMIPPLTDPRCIVDDMKLLVVVDGGGGGTPSGKTNSSRGGGGTTTLTML